ncbi:MAG: 23S rRNA (pseudouridine(1915)-N(3))-methyltransferase RlmH [Hyphomicrobiaceae bacterium]
MRLVIAAIGRLKDEAERTLYDRYTRRLATAGKALAIGPVETIELAEGRQPQPQSRRQDEATRLLAKVADAGLVVALEESGRTMSSETFARWLARVRDEGTESVAFVLGGPDGQGEAVGATARLALSLGAMTLPHGLARVIVAEQLYRAATILSGHPYHRA